MTSIFRRRGRRGYTLQWSIAGRPQQRQFPTKKAAEAFSAALALNPGLATRLTFGEYARAWQDQARASRAPGTARLYDSAIRNHLIPAFGAHRLGAIQRHHVKVFVSERLQTGLARSYVAVLRRMLHTILASAVDDRLIAFNPARGDGELRIRVSRGEGARAKAFTAEQLQRFLAAARRKLPPTHWRVFRVMASTGLRIGEALGLQWEDLDLAAGRALIRRQVTQGGVTPTTKTERSARGIDLSRTIVAELEAWEREARARALAGRGAPWVFAGDDGLPLPGPSLDRSCKRALRAAGLPAWHSPHSLRHSYASLLLAAGESVYYVQRQLGHASIRLTVDTYGSWLPSTDRGAVDRLEERIADQNEATSRKKGS